VKPYYEHAGIQIFLGDCREILPTLPKFDLLLCDPPYGIGEAAGKNKSRGKLAIAKDFGNLGWDDAPPDDEVLTLARNQATSQVVFGGNYFNLPPSSCWLVWDKVNGNSDFADCELAWTNRQSAVRIFRWQWAGMLQENMARKDVRVHPTQKPLALMKWCLSLFPDAKTVLDPFAGSGTTGVACKAMGLKCTLIEQHEPYCEVIARRLSQEVFQFDEATA
jgi:DNA modification methylase